jgi:hypothetical protein
MFAPWLPVQLDQSGHRNPSDLSLKPHIQKVKGFFSQTTPGGIFPQISLTTLVTLQFGGSQQSEP